MGLLDELDDICKSRSPICSSHFYLTLGYELGLHDYLGLCYSGASNVRETLGKRKFGLPTMREVLAEFRDIYSVKNANAWYGARDYVGTYTQLRNFFRAFIHHYPQKDMVRECQNDYLFRRSRKKYRRDRTLGSAVLCVPQVRLQAKSLTELLREGIHEKLGDSCWHLIVFTKSHRTAYEISLMDADYVAREYHTCLGTLNRWRSKLEAEKSTFNMADDLCVRYNEWHFGGLYFEGFKDSEDLVRIGREIWTFKLWRCLRQGGII